MCKKSLLMMLLMALFAPWAAMAQQALPYSYGFENNDLSADGWVLQGATSSSTGISTSAAQTGSYGFLFNYSERSAYLVSPILTGGNNGVVLMFSYKEYSSSYGDEQFQVGYTTDETVTDASAFTYGSVVTASLSWQNYEYTFPAGTKRIAIKYIYNDAFYLYLDDFSFEAPASTPKPSGLAVSNVTDNSATLNWNENGTATSWQICVNDNESNLITTSTKPYDFTGLTALTSYTVKVRSIGSNENSDWSNPLTFNTTARAEEVGDAWADDFEGESCGWELINGTCEDAWVWGTATNNGGTHALYISDDGGTSYSYSHNYVKVFAAKLLSFTDGKFTFSYDWNCYGESTYDFLRVALVPASITLTAGSDYSTITQPGLPTGWIALDGGGKLNQVQEWQNKEVAVNVAAGNYYLVLAWRSDSSTQNQPPAAVDNVSITKMACGYDVTGLEAGRITTTGATLVWDGGEASQWQVAYADNANFQNATEVTVREATYSITGLTPATVYYAKVRAYCGGTDFGAWCNAISFPTECDVITTYPYTENFDSYTAGNGVLPICWSRINTTTNTSYQGYPKIYNYYYNSNPNSLYFYSYAYYSNGTTTSDPQPQYAILPEMQNLSSMRLKLYARANSTSSNYDATFHVGIMTDPADASTFTEVASFTPTSTAYGNEPYVIPFNTYTGHGNYIAIMIEGASEVSGSYYSYRVVCIDDITVEEIPSCVEPTGLAKANVTAHTVDLSWTSDASAWVVAYKPTADEDFREVDVTTNPYTLDRLTPETAYTVKVKAKCGEGVFSQWTNTLSFTTGIACTAPTGLASSNITGHDATITWTAEEGAQYQYALVKTAEYNANNITWSESFEGNTQSWNNLDPETNYTFALRKDCGSEDGYSSFVTTTFTTDVACPAPTNLAVAESGITAYGATATWNGTSDSYVVMIGEAEIRTVTSDFEDQAIPANFTNDATYPWTVTAGGANDSGYCIIPGNAGVHSSSSDLTCEVTGPCTVSFMAKVSSESGWDKGRFFIDDTQKFEISGTQDWTEYSYELTEGTHTLIWRYYKDGSGASGSDLFYVDNIAMPIPVVDSWTEYTTTEQTYTFEDLIPETLYQVKVKGNCGDDGYSVETTPVNFTTLATCPVPTNIAVTTDGVTATATWEGSATDYNIDINGTVYNNVTSPYTFNVELNTTYAVMVQANCPSETSGWTNAYSFTTPPCVGGHRIEYVLTDTYGDGWNGHAINISDACGVVVTLANENLDGTTGQETQTGSLDLCGNYYQFTWRVGSYPGEVVFSLTVDGTPVFTDQSGNSLTEGQVLLTFGTAPTMLPMPTDLVAGTPEAHSVSLSWTETGEAGAWQICVNDDETNLIDVRSNENYILSDLSAETEYTVKVRATDGTNVSCWSDAISFTTDEACLKPTDLTFGSVGTNSVLLSWTENGEANEWQICVNNDEANLITADTNEEFSLEVTPDTYYAVKVRANCGDDQSGWSNTVRFTTEATCPAPANLTASNLTQHTADISWEGTADSYNVKYREATVNGTVLDPIFEDGFENGLNDWTTYAVGNYTGDQAIWQQYNATNFTAGSNHSGNYVAMSRSYAGGVDVSVDNWLVSPQMMLGDVVKFWVAGDDAGWQEYYAVYVSIGTNAISDFVFVEAPELAPGTGEWAERTVDLSAYAGQEGYVAIRHTDEGKDYLLVDDFGVYNTLNTYSYANEQTMTCTTTSCALSDLTPETYYEVNVQSNCGDEDGTSRWATIYFTTPDACTAPTSLVSTDITATTATLSWADNQDSYNVRYRKIHFFEGFEGETLPTGWTTIDANEDGNTWGIGHATTHSGNNGAANISYIYNVTGTTPDDYLVSPLLDLQGTMRVWLSGFGTSNAEHFEILLSTTGNTAEDFTVTLVEETTTSNEYVEYTADLSSYAGQQGYIAIHHFNCTDQRYLYVDDFGIYGGEDWMSVSPNEATTTLTNLTPETTYEWQVQGIDCDGEGGLTDWSAVANFTTLEQPTITQTIALAAGANWVSFYVDITLDDLKAALVAVSPNASIKISGKNTSTTYVPRTHRWSGSLQWDLAQMYKIRVVEACEITLEGMPIDPAEHPVTIVKGTNYIAFPLAENMSLTNAFAGFAVNGDKVLSKTSSATYNRGRWQGSGLTNLVPGSGYIYKSAATESRTLVFPTIAK